MTEEEKARKRRQFENIANTISKKEVTRREVQEQTQDMSELNKIKRLQMMEKLGQPLTKEQKLLLEEYKRNFQRNMIEFQQRQDRKKGHGMGLERC